MWRHSQDFLASRGHGTADLVSIRVHCTVRQNPVLAHTPDHEIIQAEEKVGNSQLFCKNTTFPANVLL